MAKQIYDVIVIGTGAGGGMAIKTLCEAGLKVCALNAGRALNPGKDFRNHRMPYDMKFRGYNDPKKRAQSYGYMDSEYTAGIWEHEITYTTAPGTQWMWPRCFAVGGKTNFWGRSAARMGDIDFQAATLDGFGVNWPVKYEEIAPYYSRVEKMIGVASTVQNRPSNPDGEYIPAMNFRCFDWILKSGADKLGVPYLPDREAQLTQDHNGHPACHYCGNCTEGCDTGAFFSSPRYLLPAAQATKNLELRTNALAKNILIDEKGHAAGVAYIDRLTKQEVEVHGRAVVVAASTVESARIILNSKSRHWPNGIANSSGQAGAAGAEYEGCSDQPEIPGFSLHETGTLRMGDDAKHFVTNKFGQTHDVPNLFVTDASVFLNCTDKTTTLSILAFSMRASEYLADQMKHGALSA